MSYAQDDIYIRYARMCESRDVAEAKLYLVHNALSELLAFVDRVGGYSLPEDQQAIRMARIALTEVQR